ncbi:hypothetical protein [Bdellovibrio sp. NC01]|uniref:hypothetical protein n=1 Tax=Bdellovibrio sp. NC01 TaxID=2220073 RepID=UPI001157F5DB|nr:hypothetical protein [Bdellovibrio sp. NC01]QDK38357.1 hypothetical protein DOE51_12585 [Bdellovibrio sp. NC01]
MNGILLKIAVATAFTSTASAQDLTPQAFFNRCYVQLTGKPVPLNHALMKKVIAGQTTAQSACSEVLRKGLLAKSGALNTPGDTESKAVLNTFYTFHRTWFPTNNINSISGYSSGEQNGTADLYDASEPALAVTYSVFGVGQKYSDVLNRTTGVHAMRSEDAAVAARMKWVASHPGRFIRNDAAQSTSMFSFREPSSVNTTISRNINKHLSTKIKMPQIEVGTLIGIRPTTESVMVPNISLTPLGSAATDKGSYAAGKLNYSYDFFKPFGGGVLGSPIYVLQNLGHGYNMKFNGQTKVARRWSQANMNTFLCASLPALREADVKSFVSTTSTAPFRNSTSCVMCHATLDPMAYTARNITVGATDIFLPNKDGDDTRDAAGKLIAAPLAYVRTAVAVTTYKPLNASVSGWPTEPVTDFHLQKPTGRLFFRSFTGALVDKSVADMAGLGKAMSETDDYYLCAAKRYFEFMTGISVPLYDRTDPRNADMNKSLTANDIADRNFIDDLASKLRSTGSVITLLEDIMASDYYKKENYR